jgi:hypothetical protein
MVEAPRKQKVVWLGATPQACVPISVWERPPTASTVWFDQREHAPARNAEGQRPTCQWEKDSGQTTAQRFSSTILFVLRTRKAIGIMRKAIAGAQG